MDAQQIFEILVRENSQMLTAYLRSVTCDDALIDDVWQETMLVAWRRIGEFDSSRPFGPWLRGIASKLLLASRRKSAIASQREVLVDEDAMDYLNLRFQQVQQLKGDALEEKTGITGSRRRGGLSPTSARSISVRKAVFSG